MYLCKYMSVRVHVSRQFLEGYRKVNRSQLWGVASIGDRGVFHASLYTLLSALKFYHK